MTFSMHNLIRYTKYVATPEGAAHIQRLIEHYNLQDCASGLDQEVLVSEYLPDDALAHIDVTPVDTQKFLRLLFKQRSQPA